MIFKAQLLKLQSLQKNALEKALENRVMELMKEKPFVKQLEIAKRFELSRTKVQMKTLIPQLCWGE